MNFDTPAVIIGMGEMGGSFARGLLRLGHSVVPVLRSTPVAYAANRYPEPLLALITVGEADLDDTLADLPAAWKTNTGLVQNELLARSWLSHDVIDPTVAVVWFEKKPGRAESPIMPTPIAGRHATILVDALARIDIPAFVVRDEAELLYELVRKNVYIIAMNVGGLVSGGTMRDLWYNHRELAENVARDVISVQEWLTGSSLDADRYVAGLVEAIDARPDMGATGRSAPARLARALNHADTAGLAVPSLRKIAATIL